MLRYWMVSSTLHGLANNWNLVCLKFPQYSILHIPHGLLILYLNILWIQSSFSFVLSPDFGRLPSLLEYYFSFFDPTTWWHFCHYLLHQIISIHIPEQQIKFKQLLHLCVSYTSSRAVQTKMILLSAKVFLLSLSTKPFHFILFNMNWFAT